MVSSVLLVALLAVPVASAPDAPARNQTRTSQSATDKAAIFGSATLVPTREGERARAELAVAGEAARLVARLPGVRDVALTAQLQTAPSISGVVSSTPTRPPTSPGSSRPSWQTPPRSR